MRRLRRLSVAASLVLILVALQAGPTAAREVLAPLQRPHEQAASLALGVERAPLLTLGYAHRLEVEALPRSVTLVGELGLPILVSPLKNLRATLAARVLVLRQDATGWNLLNRLEFKVVTTENFVHDSLSLGLGDSLLGGYFGAAWFAAAELGYYRSLSTHIEHTPEYKDVYAEARDGWYRSMGGGFTLGVQAGWTPGLGVELGLRLVLETSERLNAPLGAPVTATVGAALHF